MPVDVRVYITHEIRRDLHDDSKFAFVRPERIYLPEVDQYLPAIRVSSIDDECSRSERGTDCYCVLTVVNVNLHVVIHINPDKISNSFFDPDPADPKGYTGAQRDPSHPRLDEANVIIHELSHAQDIAKAIEEAAEAELNRTDPPSVSCNCDKIGLCHQALVRIASQRVEALGNQAYRDLLRESNEHGNNSETEQRARQAQITDYEQRE